MYLKSIEIIGFKSFADRVKIDFTSGITGIVGPNGCGKSNIADAFRWVLGEQSAKSMRGGKMLDVIFAGTATRKPLNFAEVSITLAEVGGQLPTEFDEITVTRRMHRSGESEYFINRHSVRLKDVQSLFLDSGIGKDAYSIFEQGKIEQVIHFTPLERRYIFEEAAGILRFLQRKKEALRKLELAELNIIRVKDIHHEVEKQIVVLEEQAEKARVYKEKKNQLEKLEKGVLIAKSCHWIERGKHSEQKEHALKEKVQEINTQLELIQKDLQAAKESSNQGEDVFKKEGERLFKIRSEKEIKIREKQTVEERLKETVTKEKRWQHELEGMQEKRKKRKLEQQQYLKQQADIEKEIAAQEGAVKERREKVHALEVDLSKQRERQQDVQRELLKVLQEESRLESELKQQEIRLEGNQQRKTQIFAGHKNLSLRLEELEKQKSEKDQTIKNLSTTISENKLELNKRENEGRELTEKLMQLQNQLDELRREETEIKTRHQVLQKFREEMEGFSSSSKRLLQESNNPASPLFQKLNPLYEFIVPEKGGEATVAALLKPYAHTLVVKTPEDFEAVVSFAKKYKLKDFSLFCLQHVEVEKSSKESSSSLSKHVSFNEISSHFLKHARMADNLGQALQVVNQAHGCEAWLEEGIFVDHRHVVFFAAQNENNVFVREAEIKSLESRRKECEKRKTAQEELYKTLHQRKQQVQNEWGEWEKTIRKEEMKLVEHNYALQTFQKDLEKIKKEQKQFENEQKEILELLNKLTHSRQDWQERHAKAKLDVAEVQKKSSQLYQEIENGGLALKQEQLHLQDKESVYHHSSQELRKILHALHVIEIQDLESFQQEARLEEEIKTCRDLQSHIKVKGNENDFQLQSVENMLQETVVNYTNLEKENLQRKKGIEKIEGKEQEKRQALKELEKQLYQVEIHFTQAKTTLQSLETELHERYQLSMEQALRSEMLEISIDDAERNVKKLRQELEAAGDVNMTSIGEYEKHKSRYEFLNQQMDDVHVSKQELVKIIAQLDSESRKVFHEVFAKIQENFKKNFKILFDGGEADLQFTESSDVLEAGIEIIAKPPGKQMRSIHLMSGGEKCLTAMALLFAIFEVKSVPYCILDEIDAPLDDTNVGRFMNVLKQFIDRCQFIVITHNKRTMSIADVLFGVSMEERGVSKILSMQFSNKPVLATMS